MPEVQDIPRILGPEKVREYRIEAIANGRAAASPFPGATADAFIAPAAIKVGEFTVRKLVLADWVIFQKLDSPLMRMWLELQKPVEQQEEIQFTDEEGWMICWQFTTPVREAENIALNEGRDGVLERAKKEFYYDGGEANDTLILAALEQFKRHVLTRLKYVTEKKDSGEITFFRSLTDSAGSSSTPVVS